MKTAYDTLQLGPTANFSNRSLIALSYPDEADSHRPELDSISKQDGNFELSEPGPR